ncbi:FxsB family cyclophane-forming radical SAM/SPASM peptide maturase [Nonomuraea muscovyensis]|uniref:FxsB family cyclophane-forming radical SAM/SPASM peptide maturase n=1 Tax=Nonomuraea muscovyensis TaxID=1124761 RepID=UPI0033D02F41
MRTPRQGRDTVITTATAATAVSAHSAHTVPVHGPVVSDAVLESGTKPFRSFICKVASRCNLDCDYCYVYRHADQSWRSQPRRMSLETAAQLGRRINEHACEHGLEQVDLTLHGGEPLLLGVDYLRALCEAVTRTAPDVRVRWNGQTNGTAYTEEVLDFCREWEVSFGLSVDGPRAVNDRHRLDHAGRSSFAHVERSIELLSSPRARGLWGGILAVIDLESDPVETYSYFRSFDPPSIDFLLPLGHHDLRPPGKERIDATPYADWLLSIFDMWYAERPQPVRIRRFRDVIALYLGAADSSEEWGLQPVDFTVVETNGEIQAVDTLKVTYPGACELGLNIFDDSFDAALRSPMVRARQDKWRTLGETCRECELVRICGGGYFPHRYSRQNGFRNESVYCADLKKLIRVVTGTAGTDLRRLPRRAEREEGKAG